MTLNDLFFEISGGGITPTNIFNLVDAVAGWMATSYAPQLSEDWSGVRAVGFDLGSVDGPYAEVASTAVGGVASESSPGNVAACISFRTAQRGRSARGRNYVPGVPNGSVTLNTMSAGFMDNILLIYQALVGPGEFVPGWQWVVCSRRNAGVLRPAGIAIPITSVTFTTPYVRSMRTREVGHGA